MRDNEEHLGSGSGNRQIKMDLKEYIRSLGEHLLCEPLYHKDALTAALDAVYSDIQDIRSHFSEEAPSGLEPVRDFMIESLELYRQSVDDMKGYVESDDRLLIEQAMVKAEEAEDIIGAIEEVIQEQRSWLSESTEA